MLNITSYKTALENCIVISNFLNGLLSSVFDSWFKFSFDSHSYNTRWPNRGYLKMLFYQNNNYGRYSVTVNAIYIWNNLQRRHQDFILYQLSTNKLEEILITFFLNSVPDLLHEA